MKCCCLCIPPPSCILPDNISIIQEVFVLRNVSHTTGITECGRAEPGETECGKTDDENVQYGTTCGEKNVCRAEPTKSGKAEQQRNDECGRAEPTMNETECGIYECGGVERARKGTECGKDGEELSRTKPTMPMGAKKVECGKVGYERVEPGD